jgi:poly-gamma-glutamate capsule biosynthesis protein CapA/YwtB (metallophosphatase superfamily)
MAAGDDVTLALCGDVMLGRGIDQILPSPGDPRLYESYMDSALGYVRLAEAAHGAMPRGVSFDYVWGDMLADLEELRPQARIANLETSITTSDTPVPKGINYRMHPGNAGCLTAAAFDCCVLANNHVLDWDTEGLLETLATLEGAGIRFAGAGRNAAEAAQPATIDIAGNRRVLVFGYGSTSSGIPRNWAATEQRPGVNLLPDLSPATAERIANHVATLRRAGDLVVVSIHWGSNWGYQVPDEHRIFAHALIDCGGCDLLHGHSSHHVRPIEVYRDRLISMAVAISSTTTRESAATSSIGAICGDVSAATVAQWSDNRSHTASLPHPALSAFACEPQGCRMAPNDA